MAVAERDRSIVALGGPVLEIEVAIRDRQLDDIVVDALRAIQLQAGRGVRDGRGGDEPAYDPAHGGWPGRARGIVVRAAGKQRDHRILGIGAHAHEIVNGRIGRVRKAEDVVAELVAGRADACVSVHNAEKLLEDYAVAADGVVDLDVGLGAGARGVDVFEIEHEQHGQLAVADASVVIEVVVREANVLRGLVQGLGYPRLILHDVGSRGGFAFRQAHADHAVVGLPIAFVGFDKLQLPHGDFVPVVVALPLVTAEHQVGPGDIGIRQVAGDVRVTEIREDDEQRRRQRRGPCLFVRRPTWVHGSTSIGRRTTTAPCRRSPAAAGGCSTAATHSSIGRTTAAASCRTTAAAVASRRPAATASTGVASCAPGAPRPAAPPGSTLMTG